MNRRYEMSISVDYVSNWEINEALREIFQNAIDNSNYDFEYKDNNLQVISYDVSLDKNTLLLGVSTKGADSIGQFGEGYKLACLVLARNDYDVTIINGKCNEIWKPKIIKSRRYGADILVFDVSSKKIDHDNLIFEINGITDDLFEEYKDYNLNLLESVDRYITEYGDILLEDRFAKRIYVEGLFVCDIESLTYGYNFKLKSSSIKLNRDRDRISSFDTIWQTSKIWASLISTDSNIINTDNFKKIFNMEDVRYINTFLNNNSVRDSVLNLFIKIYGDKAYPVNTDELKSIACERKYFPVFVSDALNNVILERFEERIGKDNVIKEKTCEEKFFELIDRVRQALEKSSENNDLIEELDDFIDNYIFTIEE